MNVVIGCLNSKYIHASLAPWCLLAGCREFLKCDAEISVLESTINGNISSFAEEISEKNPQAVALCCYIWNITKTLELAKIIKEKSGAKIVLGGPEVAYRAESVLKDYPFVDFVLSGEGEFNFPPLIDSLETGDFSTVSGLCARWGDAIFKTEPAFSKKDPPSPYCDEFFAALNGRIAYIETGRGCPFRCAFCLSGRIGGVRYFDIERVKSDILKLANSGTQTLKFVDRTFNANAQRCNEILLFIKENYGKNIPNGVCFHFEIAGDILREDTLEILSQMPLGAVQLEIGMQSFNEQTLKMINRKTNTEKLIKNIKKLVGFNNMHIHIDLIVGLKGEDFESFERSFNIGYSLGAHMLQMGFLKLLYGSDMRENPEDFPCEFSSDAPYEVTQTPWLNREEIACLKNCEDALERLYNSGRFLLTLDFLINQAKIEPFKLFYEFGNSVFGGGISLSDYSVKIYEYFAPLCDGEILKEKIVCDLISASASLQIPDILKPRSPLYKKIRSHFAALGEKDIKLAVLNKSRQVFIVKPKSRKNLFGRFEGEFYPLDEFEK